MTANKRAFSRREERAHALGYRASEDGSLVLSPSGKPLKLWTSAGRYRFNGGHGNPVPVHRFVAFQKYGSAIYTPGLLIRHKDSNPKNNHPGNLLLGTQSENMMDQPEGVRREKALKATAMARKYDHAVVLAYLAHHTYKQAREKFGCSMGNLSFIKNASLKSTQQENQ